MHWEFVLNIANGLMIILVVCTTIFGLVSYSRASARENSPQANNLYESGKMLFVTGLRMDIISFFLVVFIVFSIFAFIVPDIITKIALAVISFISLIVLLLIIHSLSKSKKR